MASGKIFATPESKTDMAQRLQRTTTYRDIRLTVAIIFLMVAFICSLLQGWIIYLYFDAMFSYDWSYFGETFGVEIPSFGPDEYCFGRCVAELPLLPAWAAVVCFVCGLSLLLHCWWKPHLPSEERS